MGGGCPSTAQEMKKEKQVDEESSSSSSIRKIIKECLVEQEASLKVVISGLESQIQELKDLFILHLNTTTPTTAPADHDLQPEELDGSEAAAAVGDDDDDKYEPDLKVTSVVPLAPATSSPTWKYDIFISFRGDDTRRGFASHLFHALKNADLSCYRDVDVDERGQVVGPMLIDAIHHSMMAIILFSKNYADSKWCLQELVEILRFNKLYRAYGHTILPIFYDVGPSEVRNQSGRVGEAFKRCKAKTKQEKEQWRDALVEAGNLSSWHLVNDANGDEAEFIEKIVEELQNRVFYSRNAYFVKSPVGMEDNVNNLISLLDTPTSISKVGIYGAQGIGKTTLAKLICRKLYTEFQGRVSLLENIHDMNINEESVLHLQTKLVQDVLKIRRPVLFSGDKVKNVGEIRKRLYQKKVLLVLDGVEKSHEMFSIIGGEPEKFLHPGSIILITTRNKKLLDDLKVDKIDMIPPLNPEDSLRLFYQHAFIDEPAKEEVEDIDLSENLVHYAGGLPLALNTLGTFLFDKPKDEWHQMLGKLVRSPRLDSIGVNSNYVSPLYTYKKVGYCGGSTDHPYDHGKLTTVRRVKLCLAKLPNGGGDIVRRMIVDYDYNGSFISSGGTPVPEESVEYRLVTLEYPDEYLTKVSGYIDKNCHFGAIGSIKFYSNKREFGPYGEEKGIHFSFYDSGSIIGFFGHRDNSFLASIGAYFGPVPSPSASTTAGPFGGCKGKRWDDEKHLDIKSIKVIVHDSGIKSICITYDNYGHPLGPLAHGDHESDAKDAHLVELKYPYEYLTAISGYVGKRSTNGKDSVVVRSLTFHSNKRTFGPFGDENGQRFFTPQSSGMKIVGFFGREDDDVGLEAIGVYVEAVSHVHPKRVVGPFGAGGNNGEIWDDGQEDCSGDIRKMLISWGSNGIVSVSRVDDELYDYPASTTSKLIELDCSKEYIKAMEGWFQVEPNGDTVIKELTFETNIEKYGPYGDTSNITFGTYFRTPWNVGKITGFYGNRSGDRLSSIGAYFGPVYHDHPLETIGPFGDYFSGTQWDDGSHIALKQINLRYGAVIDSISLVYADANWSSLPGNNHGSDGGYLKLEIVLDWPNEYVVGMTGRIGTYGDYLCVRCLTFETNKRKLGPYGTQEGKYFSIRSSIGKIVGIYGSSSNYLLSVGAHIQLL